MKRLCLSLVVLLLSALFTYAQTAAQQPAPNAPQSAASSSNATIKGSFPLVLPKGIDSKKLKVGDTVVCQTAAPVRSSIGIIPSGSRVIGHVTEAKARSKGDSESTLGLAFDKIEYGAGKEVALKGTLQAVAPSLGDNSGPNTGAAGSGVLMGGHGADGGSSGPGTTAPPMSGDSMMTPKSKPILLATSEGVLGIKNLELNKDGILTSPNKEVRLDNGTQLLIRAEIQLPPQ